MKPTMQTHTRGEYGDDCPPPAATDRLAALAQCYRLLDTTRVLATAAAEERNAHGMALSVEMHITMLQHALRQIAQKTPQSGFAPARHDRTPTEPPAPRYEPFRGLIDAARLAAAL